MVNDTTTLNGALAELGETLATNISAKGVSASASDGLTTLANKINQIYTGECYFLDSLDTTDYILQDSTISSVTLDNGSVKIANTYNGNKSIFFTLNRGTIVGNFKVTYDLKTSSSITLYQRIGTSRTQNTATISGSINLSTFKSVEWTVEDGTMTVKVDGSTFGTNTYTDGTYFPIFAFYFNKDEYVNIKNMKIVRI